MNLFFALTPHMRLRMQNRAQSGLTLYKYMRQAHLDAFLDRGSLKIGTLYEYRAQEELGGVIGDRHEGLRFTEFSIPGGCIVDLDIDTPASRFLNRLFPGNVGHGLKVEFKEGSGITFEEHIPDCFTYCVSTEFNRSAMTEFGYDGCLEIVDPVGFLGAVSESIREIGAFWRCTPITYRDRNTYFLRPHDDILPCFIKGLEYEYQKEARAIWVPTKAPIEPLFIDVPNAIKYCRTFDVAKSDR